MHLNTTPILANSKSGPKIKLITMSENLISLQFC